VLCGDEEGNVWIYDIRLILKQPPPLAAAPQAPTQVPTDHSSPGQGCTVGVAWHWGTGAQPPLSPYRSLNGPSPRPLAKR
jgi:hypothetical protein